MPEPSVLTSQVRPNPALTQTTTGVKLSYQSVVDWQVIVYVDARFDMFLHLVNV